MSLENPTPVALPAGRVSFLRGLARDPLAWVGLSLFCFYLIWVMLRPPGVFWSLDEGGKLIYIQNVLKTGHPSAPLIYPGRILDPDLRFVPLYFFIRRGDLIYSWWPIGFPLLSLPLYELFGWVGLYILPAISGALCAYFAGAITRRLCPQSSWLSLVAAFVTGLATPVTFYSTVFWEHTPSVAMFLGSVFALLVAWYDRQKKWLLLAGILGSLSIFLRLDVGPMLFGIGLVLLVLRWKDGILFGASLSVASVPWMMANWRIMGNPLEPRWDRLATTGLFAGLDQVKEKFVPYVLFNAPKVGAFALSDPILWGGALLTVIGVAALFFHHWQWLSLPAYAGVLAICAWVLIQSEIYRSVHGFVLIAPHVLFASWLLVRRRAWGDSPFVAFVLAAFGCYGIVYVLRAWIAAGGLQWGPRYMLALYPLLVIASLVGLVYAWPSIGKHLRVGLTTVYLAGVLVGLGFEARGLYSTRLTMGFYSQSGQAVRELGEKPIVTECSWLPLVVPDLYWNGNMFNINGIPLESWLENARRAGINTFDKVEMLSCNTTPLDQVQREYARVPGGIEIRELSAESKPEAY